MRTIGTPPLELMEVKGSRRRFARMLAALHPPKGRRRTDFRVAAEALRKYEPDLTITAAGGPSGGDDRQATNGVFDATAIAVSSEDVAALRGRRVVICEDEGINQMQLRRAVTRAGMQVVGIAANGREGIETALRVKPDIVLMDIRMPVMDGLEAAETILRDIRACVVMLTAFSDAEYKERAAGFGASGYVVKPVTGDSLLPQVALAWKRFTSSES